MLGLTASARCSNKVKYLRSDCPEFEVGAESNGEDKKAKAEYFFSRNGWLHVLEICEDLARAAREAHREDLVRICRSRSEASGRIDLACVLGGEPRRESQDRHRGHSHKKHPDLH